MLVTGASTISFPQSVTRRTASRRRFFRKLEVRGRCSLGVQASGNTPTSPKCRFFPLLELGEMRPTTVRCMGLPSKGPGVKLCVNGYRIYRERDQYPPELLTETRRCQNDEGNEHIAKEWWMTGQRSRIGPIFRTVKGGAWRGVSRPSNFVREMNGSSAS